jgi:hypothetical protein
MKNRTDIDAADLYVLLQREFRRRQPTGCDECFVQLPFRVDRHDAHAPNWELVMPPNCNKGCAPILEELVLEYGMLYDLRADGSPAY